MTAKPKPGGYIDRGFLAEAQRKQTRIAELVGLLVDDWERMGRAQRLMILAQLGVKMTELGHALQGMERIREGWVQNGTEVD